MENKITPEESSVPDDTSKDKSRVHFVETAEDGTDDADDLRKFGAEDARRAAEGTLLEHEMPLMQALRKYWKASAWSMFVSLCVVMRAYDIEITGNFFALPAFQKRFGEVLKGHGYQVPTEWQIAMGMGAIVGQVIGAWACAIPMDRLGRRKTLALYLSITSALVFMQVFAPNIGVLTASMYLQGIIWGGYHVLAPAYASEVLPLRLRYFMTGTANLSYVIGQLLQTGITRAFINWDSDWAWRTPYAIQWVWPAILLIGLIWCPESPWWLIRKGRLDEAKKALDSLTSREMWESNHNTLAMMVRTDLYEQELEDGATYRDCFSTKNGNRRRLEICSMLFITQNFSGNPVGFATYLFEQVGLSTANAFNMSIGLMSMNFVGAVLCAFPLTWFGRRTCWLFSLCYAQIILWPVALMCFAPNYKSNHGYAWAQSGMLISMQLSYALTIGPLGFIISSDTPSTRLRAKTLSLTATFNGATYLVLTILGPYLLNPGAVNAGAKMEFLFAGVSVFSLIWAYFRLPETKGRTYEEQDWLFSHNVPTKKFKGYVVPIEGACDDEKVKADQEATA
ncbi:uncharacterized protein MYCFIDRAFT_35401 [Pseudocercospora fijiensis CIRAD86]|uniref:Major facilitator superfamily (MFS) profile domain-containing protein n=1 Tax=Pseudocercospora fijiensis (strain CIRAD86) TaxID=383855 RepID=N1QA86_PSEFD|nr:uncharacterized protein MYCFIDRAFT_35401 [Pseudocercospora fijiensis CIRAD86]EME88691.1 hypothetical protein MYCFIDRAFT_35401 [Pseudocercospora fijiensis CIRAD86]